MDKYIKQKRLEISQLIRYKKIVYLDTNYWIKLRKEHNKTDLIDRKFFNRVNELVVCGKCIFPISEITFWEIMKQSDLQSRKETMEMVDKFSGGIAIINNDERRQLELRHWKSNLIGNETFTLNELVFTKIPFILGYEFLNMVDTISQQKDFIDAVSAASLLEFASDNNFVFKFIDNIENLSSGIKQHEGENNTIKDLFLSELSGYLDLYSDSISEVEYQMFYKTTGQYPTNEEKNTVDTSKSMYLIYNMFRLDKITNELPAYHIFPMLFAYFRMKAKQGMKFQDENNTMDFLHASFALPYCDYFFTEKRLCNMINELKLNEIYNCIVEYDANIVLEKLNLIN